MDDTQLNERDQLIYCAGKHAGIAPLVRAGRSEARLEQRDRCLFQAAALPAIEVAPLRWVEDKLISPQASGVAFKAVVHSDCAFWENTITGEEFKSPDDIQGENLLRAWVEKKYTDHCAKIIEEMKDHENLFCSHR